MINVDRIEKITSHLNEGVTLLLVTENKHQYKIGYNHNFEVLIVDPISDGAKHYWRVPGTFHINMDNYQEKISYFILMDRGNWYVLDKVENCMICNATGSIHTNNLIHL